MVEQVEGWGRFGMSPPKKETKTWSNSVESSAGSSRRDPVTSAPAGFALRGSSAFGGIVESFDGVEIRQLIRTMACPSRNARFALKPRTLL